MLLPADYIELELKMFIIKQVNHVKVAKGIEIKKIRAK